MAAVLQLGNCEGSIAPLGRFKLQNGTAEYSHRHVHTYVRYPANDTYVDVDHQKRKNGCGLQLAPHFGGFTSVRVFGE